MYELWDMFTLYKESCHRTKEKVPCAKGAVTAGD